MYGDMDMSAYSCPYIEGLIEGVQRRANKRIGCAELGSIRTASDACKCVSRGDDAPDWIEGYRRAANEESRIIVKRYNSFDSFGK